jgi:hypothetical protein
MEVFARSDVTASEAFLCDFRSLDVGSLVLPPSYRRPLTPWFRWLVSLTWRIGITTGSDEPTLAFAKVDFRDSVSVGSEPKAITSCCSLLVVGGSVGGSGSGFGGWRERGAADFFVELNRNDRGASMIMRELQVQVWGCKRRYGRMYRVVKVFLRRTDGKAR